jgi:hypothetical protein
MRMLKWTLALAIPAVLVATARPEDQPADHVVPQGTTVKLLLLRQKSVQEELNLSPEVVRKIQEFTNKQADVFGNVLKQDKAGLAKKLEAMEAENKQFVADTLTKEQNHRLDQITLQITGLYQLTRPEVAKALNLTADQLAEVTKLQKEAREGLAAMLKNPSKEGRGEKLTQQNRETRKKIMALLTDEQRAKVREMVGKPFEGKIEIEEGPGR